jgi:hypothetical protein
VAGAFFEISISGAALGGPDCEALCVLGAKFMVVPVVERPGAEPQLHVKSLVSGGDDTGTVALLGGRKVWAGGAVRFALARATQRELVVEVRRAGITISFFVDPFSFINILFKKKGRGESLWE